MDAQPTVDRTAALVAPVQSLAAGEGGEAELIARGGGGWVRVGALAGELLAASRQYARELGCVRELDLVAHLLDVSAAEVQRRWAREAGGPVGLTQALADCFLDPPSSMHPGAWEWVGATEEAQT